MTRRLAIIPARGGSKRLKNKNIRDFCGKPMIGHIIAAAESSGLFEVIHVSTEDDTIRDVAASLGQAPLFSRPDHLAEDQTPIMPVLKYVVDEYKIRGQEFDQVWLLMACSPLIEIEDLIEAEKSFAAQTDAVPMMSVSEYPAPTEWRFTMQDDGMLVADEPGMFAVRSQDLLPRYFDTGTFVIYPYAYIHDVDRAGSDVGTRGYCLPASKAVDIDDEDHWHLAEMLFYGRQRFTDLK